MKVTWSNKLTTHEIGLSKAFFQSEKALPQLLIFHFGSWKHELRVRYDDSLTSQQMVLSDKLLGCFTLPEAYEYEVKWDGRNLNLGPVIAFLTVSKDKYLQTKLERFEPYFTLYPHFKGLIYMCAVDGINISSKTIEGYYFLPHSDRTVHKGEWHKGTFPYPGAMYRKTGCSKSIYDHLVNEIGDKIFNTYFFNKRELWEWLCSDRKARQLLPYTECLMDFQQLERFINKYGEVYLKQADGHKAKGIIKVSKNEADYHLIYRLKDEVILQGEDEINAFLTKINKSKDYIVQQAIPVKVYDERHFDFRMILQKNKQGKWACTVNIARFGKKKSIATNFLLAGYAMKGVEALKRVFGLNDREAFMKEQEMIEASQYVCSLLDRCGGHYGDLGVDVMIDENQKVWILEVNKLHDHKYPQYALQDEQLYLQVTTRPFEYASRLAGF